MTNATEERTLVLIRIREGSRRQVNATTDDEATFFAEFHDGCVTLVIPESDPRNRHNGLHMCTGEFDVLEDDPERVEEGREAGDLRTGDTVRLVTDAGGWNGSIGDLGTVENVEDGTPRDGALVTVRFTTGQYAGQTTQRFARRFERVEETPEEASQEPAEASVTLSESELEDKLRQAREEATRTERYRLQQEHQRWIDSLVEDAHQYANDNNLCGEFDRFMADHDLPTRECDYRVTFSVSVTVARDSDRSDIVSAALENVCEYDVIDVDRD